VSDILFELDKQYAKTQQEKIANNLTDQYDPSYNQMEVKWDQVGMGAIFAIVIIAMLLTRRRIYTHADAPTRILTTLCALWLPCSAAYILFFSDICFSCMLGPDRVLLVAKIVLLPIAFLAVSFLAIRHAAKGGKTP
jgi:hypothetical protein